MVWRTTQRRLSTSIPSSSTSTSTSRTTITLTSPRDPTSIPRHKTALQSSWSFVGRQQSFLWRPQPLLFLCWCTLWSVSSPSVSALVARPPIGVSRTTPTTTTSTASRTRKHNRFAPPWTFTTMTHGNGNANGNAMSTQRVTRQTTRLLLSTVPSSSSSCSSSTTTLLVHAAKTSEEDPSDRNHDIHNDDEEEAFLTPPSKKATPKAVKTEGKVRAAILINPPKAKSKAKAKVKVKRMSAETRTLEGRSDDEDLTPGTPTTPLSTSRRRRTTAIGSGRRDNIHEEELVMKGSVIASATATATTATATTTSTSTYTGGRSSSGMPIPVTPDGTTASTSIPMDVSSPTSKSSKRKASPSTPAAVAVAVVAATKKKKKKKQTTDKTPSPRRNAVPVQRAAPSDWESMYALVEELRQDRTAPVDTDGSEALPQRELGEATYRFQVLIALMLSSQTKDATVGDAIRKLQTHGLTVSNLRATAPEDLNALIGKVGFHNVKTKNIKNVVEILHEQYDGDIPPTVEGMMELPGVGPKMAFIVENITFGRQSGIGIDTHMHRMFNQLKWVDSKQPEQTRKQLESWLPKDRWPEVNLLWVGFGQEVQQFQNKLLRKALDCSRPVDALKLVKRLGLDYRKVGTTMAWMDDINDVLQTKNNEG